MKSKFSIVLLLVLLAFGMAGRAGADTQPLALAIGFEQALNLGDVDTMVGLFADNAVYVNTIGGDPIVGRDAIRALLDAQSDPDRAFEVIYLTMNGDRLTMMVDISDRGITWGRQTLEMVVEDGLIRSLEPVTFRFLF